MEKPKIPFNRKQIFDEVDKSNERLSKMPRAERRKLGGLTKNYSIPTSQPFHAPDELVESIQRSIEAMRKSGKIGKSKPSFRVDHDKTKPVAPWWDKKKERKMSKKALKQFETDYNASYQRWLEGNPVMFGYYAKGFVKTKEQIDALHMSYSPYKVPEGLTKADIEKRIADFHKGIREKQIALVGNRVEIRVNGQLRLGTSITSDLGKDGELISFLEELVKVLKAPKIPLPKDAIF